MGLFGSSKKPLTSRDLEKKILESQGFVMNHDIFVQDIDLPEVGGYLHYIETGRGNKDQLLLIHGFGATGVYFWKLMRQLKDKFHIFAIDHYGKGNSSRPPFTDYSYEATCNFFVEAISEFADLMNLENYYLLGHSFGGYVSAQFVRLKNPSLKHFFLLSPLGFTYKSKDQITEDLKKDGYGAVKRKLANFAFFLIETKDTRCINS